MNNWNQRDVLIDMNTANRLYFGDCLEVMRESIASDSVDLIYLDPPFNSKRLYNAFIGGAQNSSRNGEVFRK